tara:strand:+ start:359 stop:592 length:234 start_codon:yes stop_codon:yes gene_type:complete
MESNKQEESNLLNDNPIAVQAGGSWISKHMGGGVSPLQSKGSMAYQTDKPRPDYPDIDGDGDKGESMAKAAKDKKNK